MVRSYGCAAHLLVYVALHHPLGAVARTEREQQGHYIQVLVAESSHCPSDITGADLCIMKQATVRRTTRLGQ